MGFSAIADRMVWPPSLSRDRNWPRPPICWWSAWNNTLNACNSRYIGLHTKTVDNIYFISQECSNTNTISQDTHTHTHTLKIRNGPENVFRYHLNQFGSTNEIFNILYHFTVCTVVQNCCKGDEPCQWKTPIFRPSGIENPITDRHETWQGWLSRGCHPTCKLWYFYP